MIDLLEKIDTLPESVKDLFWSNTPRLELKKACFSYNVSEDKIPNVATLVRDVFLYQLRLIDFPNALMKALNVQYPIAHGVAYEIVKNIFLLEKEYFSESEQVLQDWENKRASTLISSDKVQRRLLDSEPWIEQQELRKKQEAQEEAERVKEELKKYDKLSISQALAKYTKLGEQAITGNPLKLKLFATPVRPSIKNWITDYHDFAGMGKHNAFERGNYIFHNENAKRLTLAERQKLTILLRSLDEEVPVFIESESQTIAFIEEDEKEAIQVQKPAEQAVRSEYVVSKSPQSQSQQRQIVQQMPRQTDKLAANVSDAPYGKTVHLSAMEHLANMPFKQVPRQNFDMPKANPIEQPKQIMMQNSLPNQEIPRHDSIKTDKVAQYFFQNQKPQNIVNTNVEQKPIEKKEYVPAQNSQQQAAQNLTSSEPIWRMPQQQPQTQPKPNFLERGAETIQREKTKQRDSDMGGSISFSSPQTFPAERKRVRPVNPYHIAPHNDYRQDRDLIHFD